MSRDTRAAFEAFKAQRNADLKAEGVPTGSAFYVTNSHYQTWLAAQEHALTCPFPCGWKALFSTLTSRLAYFSRATLGDEVSEPVREAGIDLGKKAQTLAQHFLAASQDHKKATDKEST